MIVEVTSTPAPTPVVVVATPTPDLSATVAAMVADNLPTPTSVVVATEPTDTPRPTYTPRPTPTAEPIPTPNISATVSAELTRVVPTLSPTSGMSARTISEMVDSVEDGLVQIVTPYGSGSGFVVSEDGLIVTNSHVVGRDDSVEVRFVDGRSLLGEVLGRNDTVDLAVVQVESRILFHPMVLGDASAIQAGDEVVALGFPLGDILGRDYTVTTGVVSSQRIYGAVERIQTDAAINPGNSGGPLINRDGHVIGVNTETFVEYEGISFAISVSEIKKNLDSLVAGNDVIAEGKGDWWTYENDECRYSLLVHSNWTLAKETNECSAYFERYEGIDLVGSISIWMYQLETAETLQDFAERWRDDLVRLGRDWETFELISFEPSGDDHAGYVLSYIWRDSEDYCVSSDTDLVVESSVFRSALIFSWGYCSFMPQSAFDEIASMEFNY